MEIENATYATVSNFGTAEDKDSNRPWVKEVTVPETIKRKYPSKHYVSELTTLFSWLAA